MRVKFYIDVMEMYQHQGKLPEFGLSAGTTPGAYLNPGSKRYCFEVDIPCLNIIQHEQLEVMNAREIVMTPKTKEAGNED